MRVRTQSWADVVEFYDGLVKDYNRPLEPIFALVEFIADSPYASGLFPYISHDALGIGRSENFFRGDSELNVSFNPKKSNSPLHIPSDQMTSHHGLDSALQPNGG